MSKQAEIRAKCQEVFAKATALYGMDFSNVDIRFDLKGRAAGQASRRFGHLSMRFNYDMLNREAFDHVLNDTVPHEIAHLVCFVNPMLGRNHDYGWQRVCIALGGSGARCHKEEVVYGKGRTFEYTSTTGHKTRVSETIHKRIQAGQSRHFSKRSMGSLNNACAYSIVGEQGRTFAQPAPQLARMSVAAPVNAARVLLNAIERRPAALVPQPAMQLSQEAKNLMGYGKPPVPSYNPNK